MPPRRRPAAAVERAPPARGGALRRRPAAREEGRAEGEGEVEGEALRLAATGASFGRGEKVKCEEVPLEVLRRGLPISVEGIYWGARGMVSGLVENLSIRTPKDVELEVKVQGTTEESLLKWATGHSGQRLRVHLCGDNCPEKLEAEDFIHGTLIQKRMGEDDPWMTNLIEEASKPEGTAGPPLLVGERDGEVSKAGGDKTSPGEEKDAKKKDKRKRKRSESPEKGKAKVDLKAGARKELKDVFGGTGLDPDPRYRRRYAVKAQKKIKKKKKDSSSSGSSGSEETSASESVEVFEEQQKVRRLSRRAPGVLAALAMREMQGSLLTASGGVWHQDQTAIQPLAVQYYRQALAPRLQGGPGREGLTLCWAIDLALQGRMAECVDALVQRLKSVEMSRRDRRGKSRSGSRFYLRNDPSFPQGGKPKRLSENKKRIRKLAAKHPRAKESQTTGSGATMATKERERKQRARASVARTRATRRSEREAPVYARYRRGSPLIL